MNEKQRKEIAKFATQYLKNRMMINQKLISMGESQIDFEKFMTLQDKYLEILDYAEEHPTERIEEDGEQISLAEKTMELKRDFVRRNADSIVMTEEEIDELMSYIKESIEKYGLKSTDFYNETFFIRDALSQLVNNIKETKKEETDERLKRIEMFLSYARANDNVGFCRATEGCIYYRDSKFYISTHNSKPFCRINEEGINEVTGNELDEEDLLLADKMYTGYLTNNENMNCIFLEKIIDGQRKMKAISFDQEIYDIVGEKNQGEKITTLGRAVLLDKMNDFFEKIGLSFLSSNIYTKDSFRETIDAFNKYNSMSPDDRNEIEKIVDVATSWWIDQLSTQSFESGIEGKIGENLKLLANMLNDGIATPREKDVQKFKEILGNKIRIILLSRYSLALMTDYRPEGELALALKESKVKGGLPIKTSMNISRDKIEVKKGYSAPYEVIYSKDMDTNLKK